MPMALQAPNFAKAHQFKIVSAPNGGKFFSSADLANKELYASFAGTRFERRT